LRDSLLALQILSVRKGTTTQEVFSVRLTRGYTLLSLTMRLSFEIVLDVLAVFTSLISATPVGTGVETCDTWVDNVTPALGTYA